MGGSQPILTMFGEATSIEHVFQRVSHGHMSVDCMSHKHHRSIVEISCLSPRTRGKLLSWAADIWVCLKIGYPRIYWITFPIEIVIWRYTPCSDKPIPNLQSNSLTYQGYLKDSSPRR